jgi:hypothetical protein
MEQYPTHHSGLRANLSSPSPLHLSNVQGQDAYTQSYINPPAAYTALDRIQELAQHPEHSENDNPSHNIQIIAPVPLSFSARSKDVLYSMISNCSQYEGVYLKYTDGPEGEIRAEEPSEDSTSIASPLCLQSSECPQEVKQVSSYPPVTRIRLTYSIFSSQVGNTSTSFSYDGDKNAYSSYTIPPAYGGKPLDSCNDIFTTYSMEKPSTLKDDVSQPSNAQAHYTMQTQCPPKQAPSKPIKSISPATLIALTEPFLMDWCIDPEWAANPPTTSEYDNCLKSTITRLHHTTTSGNSWGY